MGATDRPRPWSIWYLFAFLSVPVAVLACAGAVFGSSMLDVLAKKWMLLFTEMLPQLIFLNVFFIVAEEIGFTGFLQARLQDEYGPLKASVLATLPFALYHLPGLMVAMGLGLTRIHVALGFLGILAVLQMFGRVVIMWLYNATGCSVLLVGLWHSSFDATTSAFGRTFVVPGAAGDAFLSGFVIPSAVVAVFAVLVVVFSRATSRTGRDALRDRKLQLRRAIHEEARDPD